MVLRSLLSLLGAVLSGPGGDGMPDFSDLDATGGTSGQPGRLPKTQGQGYFNKPSRGYFGTDNGTPRSPHQSIEDVARAAGVPPVTPDRAGPAAARPQPPADGSQAGRPARRSVPPPSP